MKNKYIIIGIIIMIIIVVCLFLFRKNKVTIENKDLEVSNIKSFYLTYTNGYMMNAYTRYELKIIDGNYVANIKPYLESDEDELETIVDKSLMEEISKILIKYNVGEWDGFDKVDKGVLDGDSFSFSLGLQDDKSIHASGYMKWPEHYRDVVNEISALFMKIYNEGKGTK